MKKAMSEPRVATWKRCCRLKPTVRLRKIGARPGGSSVTSSVVSALIKRSTSNIRVPLPDFTPAIPGGVARIVRQAVRAWKERVAKRNAMA